jgi:hypothetical protein
MQMPSRLTLLEYVKMCGDDNLSVSIFALFDELDASKKERETLERDIELLEEQNGYAVQLLSSIKKKGLAVKGAKREGLALDVQNLICESGFEF